MVYELLKIYQLMFFFKSSLSFSYFFIKMKSNTYKNQRDYSTGTVALPFYSGRIQSW